MRKNDGLDDEIMLLHLFNNQDRNSTFASYSLKKSDETANLNCFSNSENCKSDDLECNDLMSSLLTDYSHKHSDVPIAENKNGKEMAQSIMPLNNQTRVNENVIRCHDMIEFLSLNIPLTRSEPITRSNSADLDKDDTCNDNSNISKEMTNQYRDPDLSRISNLRVPSGML